MVDEQESSQLRQAQAAVSNGRNGLVWGCVILTAVVLVAYVGVGFFASSAHGAMGWGVAAIAAGLCWFGAIIALVFASIFRVKTAPIQGVSSAQGSMAVQGMMLGMMARLVFPLGGGLLLNTQSPELAAVGVMSWVLVFYFITLITETLLSLRLMKLSGYTSKVA